MANVYWFGGTGNWSDQANHWSNNSGNSPASLHGAAPGADDNAIFDASSGTGTCTVDATATCLNLDFTNSSAIIFAGSSGLTVSGNIIMKSGMTNNYSGNITMNASAGGTVTITSNTVPFLSRFTFNKTGATFQLVDDLILAGDKEFLLTAGTFDASTNSRTVSFVSAAPVITATVALSFYNLTRTPTTAAKTNTLSLAGNITVTNLFTVSNGATATNRVLVQSSAVGTARTITAASISISNADFQDITGAGAASWDMSAASGGSGNCGGNSMKALGDAAFTTAATQTATGTASFTWSTHGWTSRVPLPQDDVVISNSFSASQTITIDMPRVGKSVDFSGCSGTPSITASISSAFYGSLDATGVTGFGGGAGAQLIFAGRGNYNFTPGTVTSFGNTVLNAFGGSLTLKGDLTINAVRVLNVTSGTLTAVDGGNNRVISTGGISVANTANATLTLGSATHLLIGTGGWSFGAGAVLTANTATIKFTDTSSTAINFAGSGKTTYNNVWFDRGASTADISITGSSTFVNLRDTGTEAHTIHFANSSTNTMTTMTVNGSSGKLITLSNASSTTHATLAKAGGGVISGCDYIAAVELTGSPANTWYIGANSTDTGTTCTNIYLLDEPPPGSSSVSASYSPSVSPSSSISLSQSRSPSSSQSLSASASPSTSPSHSPSVSPSISPSVSPSISSSISPSVSESSSISASPSLGYQVYTKGDYITLPINDNDLENTYSAQDKIDVATKNDVRVDQTATQQYMIHEFKDYVGTNTFCNLEWEGQTTQEPSASTVYLQIYNRNTTTWDTVDSDNSSNASVDFILSGTISDLTNYKDENNIISCRIQQEAI